MEAMTSATFLIQRWHCTLGYEYKNSHLFMTIGYHIGLFCTIAFLQFLIQWLSSLHHVRGQRVMASVRHQNVCVWYCIKKRFQEFSMQSTWMYVQSSRNIHKHLAEWQVTSVTKTQHLWSEKLGFFTHQEILWWSVFLVPRWGNHQGCEY